MEKTLNESQDQEEHTSSYDSLLSDCHWLDYHRVILMNKLKENGIEIPLIPNGKCKCTYCDPNSGYSGNYLDYMNDHDSNSCYSGNYLDYLDDHDSNVNNCLEEIKLSPIEFNIISNSLDKNEKLVSNSGYTYEHNVNCLNHSCDQCQKDIKKFGYPKNKLIFDIQGYLCKIDHTIGRIARINVSRELFKYLANNIDSFITDNTKFKNVLILKLYEFRDKEKLREASVWYRWIFKKRMPLECPINNNIIQF